MAQSGARRARLGPRGHHRGLCNEGSPKRRPASNPVNSTHQGQAITTSAHRNAERCDVREWAQPHGRPNPASRNGNIQSGSSRLLRIEHRRSFQLRQPSQGLDEDTPARRYQRCLLGLGVSRAELSTYHGLQPEHQLPSLWKPLLGGVPNQLADPTCCVIINNPRIIHRF